MARAAVRGRLNWQRAEVLAVQVETARARRLTLHLPDWPGHLPGQHLDVRLTAPDGYRAQRSYSIASAPEQAGVDIVVEQLPDGEVSPYLTEEVRVGDHLEVRGPVGGWFVWHEGLGGPVQLIAGGSGVVPFLAMLDSHRLTGSAVPVRVLCSARREADLIGRSRLEASAARLTLAVTRQAPLETWPRWAVTLGRIDRALLERETISPDEQPQVFVCGPTGFVEAVADVLVELGHPAAHIKTERFGASGGTG